MKEHTKEQEILQRFDEIFETKTREHLRLNIPLLKNIFEKFEEDIYSPSKKYELLRKKQMELANELESTFTKEQQELFEKHWEITNQMTIEEDEQLCYFSFIMAKEIEYETHIASANNKEFKEKH